MCQLYNYFDENIFGRYQYDFRNDFSTEHASMIAKITKNLACFIKQTRTWSGSLEKAVLVPKFIV